MTHPNFWCIHRKSGPSMTCCPWFDAQVGNKDSSCSKVNTVVFANKHLPFGIGSCDKNERPICNKCPIMQLPACALTRQPENPFPSEEAVKMGFPVSRRKLRKEPRDGEEGSEFLTKYVPRGVHSSEVHIKVMDFLQHTFQCHCCSFDAQGALKWVDWGILTVDHYSICTKAFRQEFQLVWVQVLDFKLITWQWLFRELPRTICDCSFSDKDLSMAEMKPCGTVAFQFRSWSKTWISSECKRLWRKLEFMFWTRHQSHFWSSGFEVLFLP